MKRLILTALFILSLSKMVFASDISEQIRNAKCITEYPANTKYDDFDTVTFGKCEHPTSRFKYENGIIKEYRFSGEKEVTTINPIEWFVLEKQGDKALLLSKYALIDIDFEDEIVVSPWNESFTKNYLNSIFKNEAFNSNEQKNMIDIDNKGCMFLLSYDEARKYFGIDQQLSNEQYIYFNSNAAGCELYMLSWDNKVRNSKCLNYDLRAITDHSPIIFIDENGKNFVYRYNVEEKAEPNKIYKDKPLTGFYLRPAMWVSLSDNGTQNLQNTSNGKSISKINYTVYNEKIIEAKNQPKKEYGTKNIPNGLTADYQGYQLYDIDNNGVDELIICRGIPGFATIDAIYTIKDSKCVPFMQNIPNSKYANGFSSEYGTYLVYPSTDGKIMILAGISNENEECYLDFKNNDCAVFLKSNDKYYINGINVDKNTFDEKKKKWGFYPRYFSGIERKEDLIK